MFNSFLDGSKPAIECAAVCNATGLAPPPNGLEYPPGSLDVLPFVCRPRSEGRQLHFKGQVEVLSSLERDAAGCGQSNGNGTGRYSCDARRKRS
jgi:predicted homoserine dehydrogenase-like protein